MEMRLDGPQIAVFIDFENVATSAEANYGDFDVTAVTDLLRSRGRLLIKRAYGDWGRFHRYRRPMLENGIDLLQLYSVGIQQKNRADVRLAIDAMETVFTRPEYRRLRDRFRRLGLYRTDPQAARLRQVHDRHWPALGHIRPAAPGVRRVHLLRDADQRGTGRTSPMSCSCLTRASCCAVRWSRPSRRAKSRYSPAG